METVLAGAGACTAYDVVLILKRGRHAVTGCRVRMSAGPADFAGRTARTDTPLSRRERGWG